IAIAAISFVIPGPAKREPGIHPNAHDADQWIPGLHLAPHPQVRNCAPGNDEKFVYVIHSASSRHGCKLQCPDAAPDG
ncbi:PH domain-containing protein, partial [Streptomyces niveiscabiei]|uniref:hypothetical protein n=1 Tax=Streptomyces niveiscabiei TaxID=164115 RepID=UPI0038F68F5A